MKKGFGFLLVFMFVTVGLATNAVALGLGGYLTLTGQTTEWDVDYDIDNGNDGSEDWDAKEGTAGFGFVLDTAVARNELFNYRFQIGLESSSVELDTDDGDATAKLAGIAMTHDFGVGVYRTKDVRVWIGPELRMAFKGGTIEYDNEPDNVDIDDGDWTIGTFQYGIGPVVGGNFHIGNNLTLAVKTGVLWEKMTGAGESEGTVIVNGNQEDFDVDWDYESSDVYFFITFSVFYRLGDTF